MVKKDGLTPIWQRISYPTIIFGTLVVVYASLFLVSPQLGPTDDFVFLKTLQSGKPLFYYSSDFPYYDSIQLGRFTPLVSLEYNLFLLFSSSPSAFWYFFYHAVQFIIFIILFVKLLRNVTYRRGLIYLAVVIFILLPGFTLSWFRLQLPERNVIFFSTAFLLSYFAYFKKRNVFYLVIGVIFANIAIYYKEVVFVALATFSFVELLANRLTNDKKIKIWNGVILASSIIYLGLYYLFVARRSSLVYLPHNVINPTLVFIKNIFNFAFFSDPLLILILAPLAIWRLHKIIFKKERLTSGYDSLIAAALAYTVVPISLNLYGPYYLTPAYVFAIPAVIYYFKDYSLNNWPLFFKITWAATAFFLVFNAIPSGIHYLIYNKYLPVNFNQTLDFLVGDLNKHPGLSGTKPSIFLAGVDRSTGRGTYYVLADFLNYRNVKDDQFDMKSSVAATDVFLADIKTEVRFPFTVFKAGPALQPRPGDYVIVVPQATQDINSQFLQSPIAKYDLVFRTNSPLAFPNINLKSLVKFYLARRDRPNTLIKSLNFWESPDYYVFIKK